MNGADIEADRELTDRIRLTLRAVADATPVGERTVEPDPAPRRPLRPLLAVAAAAALVVGAVGLTGLLDDERAVDVQTPADGGGSVLPQGFDPATATPVFSAEGGPDDVGTAYLRARFPDHPAPGVTQEPAVVTGDRATIRWHTGDDAGPLAAGDLLLRSVGERWAVVAATTDAVDLSGLGYDGARLTGTIRTTSDESLFLDALTWQGEPVRRAPNPEGQPDAAYRFGTGGGPAQGALDVDIIHPSAPVVARVHLVGGTILSVAEVRFDPPPLAAHDDLDGCVEQATTVEKEPTPDVLSWACAASLNGAVLASGVAGDRTWELVASDEPTGHWVTLRSRDQVGVFRVRVDERGGDDPGAAEAPYSSLGPCCAMGDHTVVVGVLHPDVTAMRVTTSDGSVIEVPAVPDPVTRARFAVATVPGTGGGRSVQVEALLPDGRWVTIAEDMSIAVLGG